MNKKVQDILKSKREELHLTLTDVAELVGVNVSTIMRWENGDIANMKRDKILKLAKALKLSPSVIMGWEDDTAPKPIRIPVLGRVSAGIPIEAIEEIIDYEEVDGSTAAPGELFGLLIKGNSMAPRICDRDVVIVRKQEAADSGDVVIATINGDDAVCKRLLIYGKTILLRSNNPEYEDIDVTGRTDFHIIGKVVELRGKF
ncbi:MAG: XRE family transcriptional regulator [Lachnospiraceae bacterium]|nr:XRE family transcriptional regulator [Lachnospiraceae bacterium]